jgi:integrase/recombinase XerD
LTREPGRAYLLDIIRDARHRTAAAAPQVADWLRWLETVKGLRPASLLAYEKRAAPLLRMYPKTELHEFTEAELVALLNKVPPGSRHPTTTALVSLFRTWAYTRELIPKDPTRLLGEIRKPKQRYKETFTEAEVEAMTGLPGEDGLRMLLMLDTGLRIGELCNLRVRDVQLERGQLVVLDGKGGKDRVVPLTSRLAAAFADWHLLEAPALDDFVFGHRKPGGSEGTLHRKLPLSQDGVRKWFYSALATAGVRKLKPHTTRHTVATRLIRAGAPMTHVQKILGHSSIQTTIDCYAHLVTDDLRLSMEMLEDAGTEQ